jgi:VWFA-related protein
MSITTLLDLIRWARLRQPWRISLLLCLASSLPAQAPTAQPPAKSDPTPAAKSEPTPLHSDTTFTVDARLVNLPVVVRDKKGTLIQNLTKDDFVLRVDDHKQNIRYFDQDRNLPLTLGLLVDVSGSVQNVLDEERTASAAFLDKMLTATSGREPDKAFIIQFAGQVELLQDVTSSRPKLQAALREIDTTSPSFSNGGGNGGGSQNDPNDPNNDPNNSGNSGNRGGPGRGGRGGPRGSGGGTALYDAAFLAADEVLTKQKGRKAIIVLTDGVDNGSRENLTKAIESNQRADTIIYAIYFKGEQGGPAYGPQHGGGGGGRPGGGIGFPGGGRFPGGGYPGGGGGGYPGGGGGGQRPPQQNHADGKKVLERMTSETGGRMFEVTRKETFADIYNQIAEELRAQYRLGYTPDKETSSDGYHEIDLAMRDASKQKSYNIQTRYGYYTGK